MKKSFILVVLISFSSLAQENLGKGNNPFNYLVLENEQSHERSAVIVGVNEQEIQNQAVQLKVSDEGKNLTQIYTLKPSKPVDIKKYQEFIKNTGLLVSARNGGQKLALKIGIGSTSIDHFRQILWELSVGKNKSGYSFDTQFLGTGLFHKISDQITDNNFHGGVAWDLQWKTHGITYRADDVDQSSLVPTDQGEWASKREYDWTVGAGIGFILSNKKITSNLAVGFFHEARDKNITLHNRKDGSGDSTYDFQDFSENRNGIYAKAGFGIKNFYVTASANTNLWKRSYLITGDYDNDRRYDYNHDGIDENDYEYGYFYKSGIRVVGSIIASYNINFKRGDALLLGAEVSNIGHKSESLDFKEFQSSLSGKPIYQGKLTYKFRKRKK